MGEVTKLLAIIGSAKAGTTALARHLDAHPRARLGRRKETMYFSTMGQQVWSGPRGENFQKTITTDYETFVEGFGEFQQDDWLIDASTDYIWRAETPELLDRFSANRDVRVLCILRDPVDRAVSEYNHTIRSKLETLSFEKSLHAEKGRFDQSWLPLFYHKRRSTVSEDVQRFADCFRDRMMILDYADMRDADAVTTRICEFLELPPMQAVEIKRQNESFIPRNALAGSVLKSKGFKNAGRALVPKRFRSSVRKLMEGNARDLVTVKPEERVYFREQMADEIAACVRNPLIPTDNWTCV